MLKGWPTFSSTTDTNSTLGSVQIDNHDKPSLVLFAIIATLVGVICVAGVMCLCLLVNSKRRKQTKHFGSSLQNGQRSKRKKGTEEDAWAGPVKLGGGEREECEGEGEAGWLEDNHKEGNGTEVALSTFIANETEGEREGPNGGVGGPGSLEAKKWEEKAPLLYIDEDMVGGMGKEDMNRPNDREGLNDGLAFCLTTAV